MRMVLSMTSDTYGDDSIVADATKSSNGVASLALKGQAKFIATLRVEER
jgi:predicted hotdog family 3-hydroxylacyl-ACP dehydratase